MNIPMPIPSTTTSVAICGFVSEIVRDNPTNYPSSIRNTADHEDPEFAAQIEAYEAWQAAIWLD